MKKQIIDYLKLFGYLKFLYVCFQKWLETKSLINKAIVWILYFFASAGFAVLTDNKEYVFTLFIIILFYIMFWFFCDVIKRKIRVPTSYILHFKITFWVVIILFVVFGFCLWDYYFSNDLEITPANEDEVLIIISDINNNTQNLSIEYEKRICKSLRADFGKKIRVERIRNTSEINTIRYLYKPQIVISGWSDDLSLFLKLHFQLQSDTTISFKRDMESLEITNSNIQFNDNYEEFKNLLEINILIILLEMYLPDNNETTNRMNNQNTNFVDDQGSCLEKSKKILEMYKLLLQKGDFLKYKDYYHLLRLMVSIYENDRTQMNFQLDSILETREAYCIAKNSDKVTDLCETFLFFKISNCYLMEQYNLCLELSEPINEKSKYYEKTCFTRALCYFYLDSSDKAIEENNKAISLSPDSTDYIHLRGVLYYQKMELLMSNDDLSYCLSYSPQDPYIIARIALNYIMLDKPELASLIIDDVNIFEITDVELLSIYLNIYKELGYQDKFIHVYNKIMELDISYHEYQ